MLEVEVDFRQERSPYLHWICFYALGHFYIYDEIAAARYRDGLLLEESVA